MGTRGESIQVRRGDCAEGRQDGCLSPGERIRPRAIHYQNFVERYVQTIIKFTSALLHGQDILQAKHWNWALFHAIDCRNRVPNTKSRPMSPYEMITGRKTNLQKSFQFVFGDIVRIRRYRRCSPAQGPTKLEVRHAMGRRCLSRATRALC